MSEMGLYLLAEYEEAAELIASLRYERDMLSAEDPGRQTYRDLLEEAKADQTALVSGELQADVLAVGTQAAEALRGLKPRRNANAPRQEIVEHLDSLRRVAFLCVEQAVEDEQVDKILRTAIIMGLVSAHRTVSHETTEDDASFPWHVKPPFPHELAAVCNPNPTLNPGATSDTMLGSSSFAESPTERLFKDAALKIDEVVALAQERGANPNQETFRPEQAKVFFRIDRVDIVSVKREVVTRKQGLRYADLVLAAVFKEPRFGGLRTTRHIKTLRTMVQAAIQAAYGDDVPAARHAKPGRSNRPKGDH